MKINDLIHICNSLFNTYNDFLFEFFGLIWVGFDFFVYFVFLGSGSFSDVFPVYSSSHLRPDIDCYVGGIAL